MKRRVLLWLSLAVGWTAAPAQMLPPSRLDLAQSLAEARSAHPDVRAARQGLEAARADIRAADRSPLPQLSAKLSQIDLQHGLGAGPPWDKRVDRGVGLDWTWERGAKRAWRTRVADRTAAAVEADVDQWLLDQQIAVASAWLDLLAAQEREGLVDEMARAAEESAAVERRRLAAGDVPRQETLRIEIEAERARADHASAQLERRRAAIAFGQALGRSSGGADLQARGPWPARLIDLEPPTGPEAAAALEARPDVVAARRRIDAAEAALSGSEALRTQDITWGIGFDRDPRVSNRMIELRASMPLTWGYHYEGEIGRAAAMLRQAEALHERTRLAAAAELERLAAEAVASRRRADLNAEAIVPRARQVAEAAEFAYRRGAMPLTDLLDARRTLRATLLEELAARTEAARAAVTLQLRRGQTPTMAPDR